MQTANLREGELYMKIGALLSALALLTIYLYQMLLQYIQLYGGRYPSGLMMIISVPMFAFGIVFSLCRAKLAQDRLGLVVAMASPTLLVVFIIQYEQCLYYCAHP